MMHHIIDSANAIRTTHNTVTNETSSRSHAICNIVIKLKNSDEEFGKLSLVDLAGSERAQETQSNDKERRAEGAEINKSLLALKECIRALDEKKNNPDQHVPFRASKLTHVLRDSFVSKSDKSRIIMISCVMPSYKCCNHSLNTLRYSDRLKEKTKHHFGGNYNNININARGVNSNPIGNNNNNNMNNNNINSNLNFKNFHSSNINYNINISNNNINNHFGSSSSNNNNALFQKSYTREITSSSSNRINYQNKKIININTNANNVNISNSNVNTNKYSNTNQNNNSKIIKKDISPKNKNNIPNSVKKIAIPPTKNETKNNNKKLDILKTKNSGIKYEDKFFMMKEDDELDKQKRNKFNYDKKKDDNNIIKKEEDKNKKIIESEKNNKNKEEDLNEKDWDYVKNKNKIIEDTNTDSKSNNNDKENNDENEEKEELQEEEEEEEGEINHIEDKEDLNSIGEEIINNHMNIVKESANILSEEGDLITNIKGVGKIPNFSLDNYIDGLEIIVDKKLDMYSQIKSKIKKYRKAQKSNGQS